MKLHGNQPVFILLLVAAAVVLVLGALWYFTPATSRLEGLELLS